MPEISLAIIDPSPQSDLVGLWLKDALRLTHCARWEDDQRMPQCGGHQVRWRLHARPPATRPHSGATATDIATPSILLCSILLLHYTPGAASPSAAGKTASSECSTARAAMRWSSTGRRRWSSSVGPRSGRGGSDHTRTTIEWLRFIVVLLGGHLEQRSYG